MIRSADRTGLLWLGGFVVILALGAAGAALLEHKGGRLDPDTGCVVGSVATAETAVLIDLTDPLPAS